MNGDFMVEENHFQPNNSDNIRKMVFASLFASMMAVGAYIEIPIPASPVPITLQTLFVLLAGAILGARWGTLSVIVYFLLGIAGLPVFSGGSSGLGMIFGPTGGFLIGFIFGTFAIGYVSDRFGTEKISLNIVSMLAGLFIIYVFGILQLMNVADLSLSQAIALGIIPYLPGAIIKLVTAAVISSRYSLNQ